MLKSISVTNCKNFNEKFVFDPSQTKDYDWNPSCIQNGIVKKAIIYGPNSVGKSNLALAISDIMHLRNIRINSQPFYQNYRNLDSDLEHTQFQFVFVFLGHEVIYQYKKNGPSQLIYESLSIDEKEVLSIDIVILLNHKRIDFLYALSDREICQAHN